MTIEQEFNKAVVAVADKYEPSALWALQEIAKVLGERGFKVEGPGRDDEPLGWSMGVWGPDQTTGPCCASIGLEVRDSLEDEGTTKGVTFVFSAVAPDGEILWDRAPSNFTLACWVPIEDRIAIEHRFQEAAPAMHEYDEFAALLIQKMNRKE